METLNAFVEKLRLQVRECSWFQLTTLRIAWDGIAAAERIYTTCGLFFQTCRYSVKLYDLRQK